MARSEKPEIEDQAETAIEGLRRGLVRTRALLKTYRQQILTLRSRASVRSVHKPLFGFRNDAPESGPGENVDSLFDPEALEDLPRTRDRR